MDNELSTPLKLKSGISKEDMDRIFDPFFTSTCAAEQMGLGLAIVDNLVLGKMSGDIKVTSELGKGSCFSLYLPRGCLSFEIVFAAVCWQFIQGRAFVI